MTREIYQIKETWINATERYIIGNSDLPVDDSTIKTLSDLYRYGVKNYGRCVSKMYIDPNARHIGYVFEGIAHYEDTKEPYKRETWLSIEHYKETINKEYLPVNKT